MAITEIFPYPTVKQVVFQIIFPNLFYIESKIGEFQMSIMKEFPESSMLYRQQFVIADMGANIKAQDINLEGANEGSKKIWHFKSPKGVGLSVLTDSLDLTSEFHKTYNNSGATNKFRDSIEFILTSFFAITKIPILTRVGLRYIDECPLPNRTNSAFLEYYNSTFPTTRFPIDQADELLFKAVIKKGEYNIRYVELLQPQDKGNQLILDFDGYAYNVKAEDCLKVTDNLHDIIADEYEKTIKQPVIEYMKTARS